MANLASTTTALAVTAGGVPVSSVSAGTVITLTATVQAGGSSVSPGTVNFCDATAAKCENAALLGATQLLRNGTAVLKLRLAPGTHSIQAVFQGTNSAGPSSSSNHTITVTTTAQLVTTTTISASQSGSIFALTGTVASYGPAATGSVAFYDSATGTDLLGSAPIETSSLATVFVPYSLGQAGFGPGSIVTGDFNGDGIPDLAVTNAGDNTIGVLIGNGDGTFQPQIVSAAGVPSLEGSWPNMLAAGDLNGDGILDLVVSCWTSPVSVLLGNGDGTFQPQQYYPNGTANLGIALGDVDGDGNLDIVTTSLVEEQVHVLLGRGDGTFQPGQTYDAGSGLDSVVLGDLNGDGKLDIVVNDKFYSTSIGVFLNNGDGTFGPEATYAVGVPSSGMVLADFNGDGSLDAAVADSGSNTVSVLLGNGNGTFRPSTQFSVGSHPSSVEVGDFNGDGYLDMVATNGADGTVSVLYGDGTGAFPGHALYAAGSGADAVVVQDLNADGLLDLAVTDSNLTNLSPNVSIFLAEQLAAAVLPDVTLPVFGGNPVSAVYQGNASHAGSTSSVLDLVLDHVPQITSLSANYGALYAIEVLTGTNFGTTQGSSTVTFNGTVAPVMSWSNTSIEVTVPYRASTGNVLVTVGGQTSNSVPFTVEPTPSVTGISPNNGPVGTLVTISGQNLLDAQGHGEVWLYNTQLPIISQSSTSLQVRIPTGAVSGVMDVHVNGVGNSTPVFTVPGAPANPHISHLSANYGALYSILILTGSGFGMQGSSTVTFNGVPAPTCCWSNTSITTSVPFRATSGNVVVTVAGQPSNRIPFTLEPTPTVTGVSPDSGPVGSQITINGNNLVDAQGHGSVWFGKINAAIGRQSSTSIQVRVPVGATTGPIDVHINGVGNYTPSFTVTN